MITDTLTLSEIYTPLHPRLAAGFEYLRRLPANVADGRYEIDGPDLFALVQSYTTTPAAERKLEHHRKFADVQYLFAGAEIIEYAPLGALEVDRPYDEANDYGLVRDAVPNASLVLRPGQWAIFLPQDAHKPGCALGAPAAVRKVVLKVRL
ncbi:MAG: YhcH/YjgK/YiaL family protein [Verrucomicrobia bacterium]|nr:YhcH/YjgK/YiaL family protein [Verrucomicrobiota bacterium]